MEYSVLPSEVVIINRQLTEFFGIDTITGKSMWRVSWAPDQTEMRLTKHTDSGIELLHTEVRELPKYQWVSPRWILERLVLIPEVNQAELPAEKQTYECMWAFESQDGNTAIKPSFEACKFLIDLIYAAMGQRNDLPKYKDPEAAATPEEAIHKKKEKVDTLVNELFGDESDLLLRTVTGEAVAYTGEPKINAGQIEKENKQ